MKCRSRKHNNVFIPYLVMLSFIICLDRSHFSKIKVRKECFFIDLKNINYINETYKMSKLHKISSVKLDGITTPFVKHYFAFENSSNNIHKVFLRWKIRASTEYTGHYSQYFSLYVGFDASLFYNKRHYKYKDEDWDRFAVPGPCIGRVDELIVLGNNYTRDNFGHSIQDFFHSLILIPKDVRKRSKVLMTIVPALYEVVELLGFNKSQEVFLNKGEWIYASHIHMIDKPAAHLTIFGEVAVEFIEFMREKLGVYKIKPDSYYFSNRVKGTGRHIINFDEIVELTKKSHPDITFKYLHDRIDNIWEGAKIWGTVKFLYTPPGSNALKPHFMNEGAVIVTPLGNDTDMSLQMLNSLGRIFVIHYYLPKLITDRKTSFWADPNLTSRTIDAGIECARLGRWPSSVYTYRNLTAEEQKSFICYPEDEIFL